MRTVVMLHCSDVTALHGLVVHYVAYANGLHYVCILVCMSTLLYVCYYTYTLIYVNTSRLPY
jgi:hypothetical protein